MVSSKYKISHIVILFLVVSWFAFIMFRLTKSLPTEAAFLFFLIAGILFTFFFKSPSITFDENSIRRTRFFFRIIYSWDDVENVTLSSNEDYYIFLFFGGKKEAMKLQFKDGTVLRIWGDVYSNMAEMRAFVKEKLNSRLHFLKPSYQRSILQTLVNKRYAGNVFTSFNTLFIAGITIFMIASVNSIFKPWSGLFLLIPLLFCLLMFIGKGFQMNYFEIDFDKLIIRNHYFPWKKKEYDLRDIEEVGKEKQYRSSTGLRIITYEFQSKLYRAGSLRDRHWNELFNDLKSLGIKISSQ